MKEQGIQSTLVILDADLTYRISQMIDNRSEFTTVTDADPFKILPISIGLLCLDENLTFKPFSVTHIAIIKKGQRVATAQNRLKVTDVISLEPLPVEDILTQVPRKLQATARAAFSSGYKKIAEKTGIALLDAILILRPDLRSNIDRIFAKINKAFSLRNPIRNEDLAAEKDAVSICLDIFGIDRTKIIGNWEGDRGRVGNSFLNGFGKFAAYEDDLINHDLRTLPGWTMLRQHMAGYAEFQNADNEKLVIINANRKPIEKALGVDLIYFHRKYEAFTLVQYKMMDRVKGETNSLYYNPNNPSHHKELSRMQNIAKLLAAEQWSETLHDFRISACPIFFKLCKKIEFNPNNASIVPGAYIPLNQWEILVKDDSTKGPDGGTQIGYHTLGKRYLGTQTFVDLVQRGLIGTQSISSAKIAAFIDDAIENGHSVMFAVDQRTKLNDDGSPKRTILDDLGLQ